MLDLHQMFLKVAALKSFLKCPKQKNVSLNPQSDYLVTAQLLTRVHFLLLRVLHTIKSALKAEMWSLFGFEE